MKQCVNCASELNDGAKFCPDCGTQQPEKRKALFCDQCGETLSPNARFCPSCAAPVGGNMQNNQQQNPEHYQVPQHQQYQSSPRNDLPPQQIIQNLPQHEQGANKQLGKVVVYREFGMQDPVTAYRIEIDGNEVGQIHVKKELEFPLIFGQHTIQFKMLGFSSPKLNFQLDNSKPMARVICSCPNKLGTAIGGVAALAGGKENYIKARVE